LAPGTLLVEAEAELGEQVAVVGTSIPRRGLALSSTPCNPPLVVTNCARPSTLFGDEGLW
jgi:hypothetical protein